MVHLDANTISIPNFIFPFFLINNIVELIWKVPNLRKESHAIPTRFMEQDLDMCLHCWLQWERVSNCYSFLLNYVVTCYCGNYCKAVVRWVLLLLIISCMNNLILYGLLFVSCWIYAQTGDVSMWQVQLGLRVLQESAKISYSECFSI